ncbi:hypothetical protein RKD29_006925 [Streptomyces tendae]
MAGSTPPAPVAGSIPAGCGGPWPRCHCRGPPTADWSWPSTSPAGYAPTCTPHRSGCRVTPTAGEKTSTSLPPAGRTRSSARSSRSQFLDRPFGRASPGPRGRHGHCHRPTAAGTTPPTDHRRAMAGGRPRRPRHRGRRIRRIPPCVPPQRPAGQNARPDALGPGAAPGSPTPPATHDGPPTPARRLIRLRPARHLGRPGHRNRHRHTPLRHRQGPLLGPAAPQAHPPLLLGHHRRHPPGRRRHGAPPRHRPPAQRSNTEAGLAVVVRHRRPPADADRLWQAYLRRFDIEHTFRLFKQTLGWTSPNIRTPPSRRPPDLAHPRRLHPTPPRPHTRSRAGPAPPLGKPQLSRPAHSRPRPAATSGTSAHRPPARPEHRNPPAPAPDRPPSRKNTHPAPRHDVHTPKKTQPAERQRNEVNQPKAPPHRFKIKLRAVL